MQIQINAGDVQHSDAIDNRIEEEIRSALQLFGEQVTRVEVHLRNLNGPRHGVDKRCVIEVRLAGFDPLAVEADSDDLYQAVHLAAGKLERAVKHKIERRKEHIQKHDAV
jgi:ribosomal subunit interface protein